MHSVTAIFYTIILLGALQGFVIGSMLYFDKHNRRSSRLLAFLIWFMSLASLNLYLDYTGWYYSRTVINVLHALIPMEIVMIMGPLIFFYIRSLLDPEFVVRKKQRYHFLPVILDLVPQIAAMIYIGGFYLKLVYPNPEPWGIFIDNYYIYIDIPRWLSLTIYIILSARYLKTYRTNNKPDEHQAIRVKWLQQFLRFFIAFQVIWFLYLVPYIIPATRNKLLRAVDWYPVYIPLAILIYWMGIRGYIVSYTSRRSLRRTASLQEPVIEQTLDMLRKAMEEDKLYLNPSLNLDMMARHTGMRQKRISAVLNQHLQKSFNEYVNQYRVEEFKKKILQQDMEHLTIMGVALECGFNSQATFQRTFKQITGMSPSGYRKTV